MGDGKSYADILDGVQWIEALAHDLEIPGLKEIALRSRLPENH